LPDNVSLGSDDIPVLSPDGRGFVFRARSPDGPHLWIHSFDSLTTRMLPIGGYPSYPFWSPDSRFIGFFLLGDTNDQLKKFDLSSGAQVGICNVKTPVAGGTWSPNGTILIAQAIDIYRVSAAGGEPRRILDPEPACKARLMPSFLPDGRHFLYGCFESPTKGTVNLGSIDSKDTRTLIKRL
jgi:eukaryotic-like serine/threonine-protein kinase